MFFKDELRAKLNSVTTFSDEEIENAPLRAKIAMSYHNDTITRLKAFLELGDSKELINKVKEFLKDNWQKIKGTSISYTALPEHKITEICCWLSEQVCHYEKENDAEFKEFPKIPLNYLMTDIRHSKG